ncbi:MAG: FAD binding domain-containing protein [Deltaproteobacteria bacterium]|nr:FAD binding domain-containing protein [Deltaproteobacteria bacterium]
MRKLFLPKSLDELWEILSKDPDISIYAGGTDFLVKMQKGIINPSSIVCIERIDELKGIREDNDKIWIGACTTHTELLSNHIIKENFPVLLKAIKVLGSPLIRNMGTIGGNICTASPAGDTLPPLYILDAELEICTKDSLSIVAIKDFITGPGKTSLKKGQILKGIFIRKNNNYTIHHYEKVGQRKALSIAIVSMAALLKVSSNGDIEDARLSWGSVAPMVIRSNNVEDFLKGKKFSIETLKALKSIVEKEVSPIDDIRATALYRKLVASNLVLRLIKYEI